MADPKTLTVVDVGTTKIVTLIGEASQDAERGYSVIGVGVAPARGIRRGQVINVQERRYREPTDPSRLRESPM